MNDAPKSPPKAARRPAGKSAKSGQGSKSGQAAKGGEGSRGGEGGRVVPLAASRTARSRCPLCGKPAARDTRPFCSRRCADLDLGQWLGGSYRLPTNEAPSEEDFREARAAEDDD